MMNRNNGYSYQNLRDGEVQKHMEGLMPRTCPKAENLKKKKIHTISLTIARRQPG